MIKFLAFREFSSLTLGYWIGGWRYISDAVETSLFVVVSCCLLFVSGAVICCCSSLLVVVVLLFVVGGDVVVIVVVIVAVIVVVELHVSFSLSPASSPPILLRPSSFLPFSCVKSKSQIFLLFKLG